MVPACKGFFYGASRQGAYLKVFKMFRDFTPPKGGLPTAKVWVAFGWDLA